MCVVCVLVLYISVSCFLNWLSYGEIKFIYIGFVFEHILSQCFMGWDDVLIFVI